MLLLTYSSRASASLTPADMDEIARSSAEKNRRLGITGFLVDFDGVFLQALEGPDEQVESLMAAISRDPRHADINILTGKRVFGRQFGFWGMNRGPLSDSGFRTAALGQDVPLDRFLDDISNPSFVHQVLFRSYLHAVSLAGGNETARAAIAAGLA